MDANSSGAKAQDKKISWKLHLVLDVHSNLELIRQTLRVSAELRDKPLRSVQDLQR